MYTILLAAILSAPHSHPATVGPHPHIQRQPSTHTHSNYRWSRSRSRPRPRFRSRSRSRSRSQSRSNTGILRPFILRRANLQPIPKIKRIYLYETTIPQGVPFHTEYRFKSGHIMTIIPQGGNVMLDPIIMIEQDNQFKRKRK